MAIAESEVLLGLTRDVYASFINISNDTKRCAGLSAIAELLVSKYCIALAPNPINQSINQVSKL